MSFSSLPVRLVLIAVVFSPLFGGCAGLARQVAKEGSPGGVVGGLATIDDPAKQQQVGDFLDGPAGEGLGRAFVRGATAEGIALATGATRPSPRPTTTPSAVQAMTSNEAGEPAGTDRAAPSVRNAVRDAALGLNDAFAQAGSDGNSDGVLAGTRDLLGTVLTIVLSTAAVLALVVIALLVSVWRILAKARRARDEARLHEAGTARLLEALRAAGGKPWAPELQAVLRESLERQPEAKGTKPRAGVPHVDRDAETAWRSADRDEKHADGANERDVARRGDRAPRD